LTVALSVIFGCFYALDGDSPNRGSQLGEKMPQDVNELKGPHYAKLNSIGCLYYTDMQMVVDNHNDFETADKLIREKRCFVIPTDTDVFIKERVKDDIVSAKYRGSTQLFYTVRSNLVAE
jgi:hypothetical protein